MRHGQKEMQIFYINASGIRTKLDALMHILNSTTLEFDMVIVAETWLLPTTSDSDVGPPRWVIFRRDRYYDGSRRDFGGGVLILVRNDFSRKPCAQAQLLRCSG